MIDPRRLARSTTAALLGAALLATAPGCLVGESRGSGDNNNNPDASGPSRVETRPEPRGANCQYGGVRVDSGTDDDASGSLEPEEIQQTSYACNARVDGNDALIHTEELPPGGDCPAGGIRIATGTDQNGDGRLESSEIDQVDHVCDGADGLDGTDGTDGEDGKDGKDGTDGTDGDDALVELSEVAPDPDGPCRFGGTRLDSGRDADGNGTLSAAEIEHTRHVCSVHVNENLTLVENYVEDPGPNCEYGGVRTEVGYDDSGDGVLDPGEVDTAGYVCNEIVVVDGKNSLVSITPATPAQCVAGGYMLETGLDDDGDGVLDPGEVEQTGLVCDGIDAPLPLVQSTTYNGATCGPEGGVLVETGLDDDGNGTLSGAEIMQDFVVCNGIDGALGYDGKNSLVRTSDHGGVCVYGGFQFEVGLDLDENGVLDANEVEATEYVCDGHDGFTSIIEVYGDTQGVCVYGGSRFETGLDLDADGLLDASEVEHVSYACDGFDGFDSLIEITVDPFQCTTTGLQFDTGLDLDGDGYLSPSEIENTTIVCDP